MIFRSAYDGKNGDVSRRGALVCKDEHLTVQSARKATDINVIVARYRKTGELPRISLNAMYGDFTEVGEYRDMLDKLNAAKVLFEQLPSKVRSKFENDAGQFVDFAVNPDNLEEMRKLGLAPVKEVKGGYSQRDRYQGQHGAVGDGDSERAVFRERRGSGDGVRSGPEGPDTRTPGADRSGDSPASDAPGGAAERR